MRQSSTRRVVVDIRAIQDTSIKRGLQIVQRKRVNPERVYCDWFTASDGGSAKTNTDGDARTKAADLQTWLADNYGRALQWAADELKADPDFVLEALGLVGF